jgi:hypothetical protein
MLLKQPFFLLGQLLMLLRYARGFARPFRVARQQRTQYIAVQYSNHRQTPVPCSPRSNKRAKRGSTVPIWDY